MPVLDSFLDAMGDTPLVRLRSVTRGVKPTVLAKLEMLNPGGSVKDRIGLRMIEAAEREGLLKPGGTAVGKTTTSAPYARSSEIFSWLILSGITKMHR